MATMMMLILIFVNHFTILIKPSNILISKILFEIIITHLDIIA